MKKLLYITFGLFICALSANSANAAALQQAGSGGAVTVVVTSGAAGGTVPGAKNIDFNPSSNVNMSGASDSTSWAVAGYHTQADRKANGQQYGMAANSNAMWFRDISTAGFTVVNTTNSGAAFTAALNWVSM